MAFKMPFRTPINPHQIISGQSRTHARRTPQIRHASTSANPPSNRLRNFIYGSTSIVVLSLGYLYITDTRASIHRYVVPPLLRTLVPDAEEAHHAGTAALKELYTLGLNPRERGSDLNEGLSVEVFGQILPNPIGISGGLDKNAEIPDALFAIGPAVVEVGGITPLPQAGNPKPRVFRLASQNAIINRYGLNSEGADVVAMRLRQRVREFAYSKGYGIDEAGEETVLDGGAGVPPGSLVPGRLLAVQIAKNKLTPDSDLDAIVRDHVYCVERLGKYADILVVNVSSPNTPGLRSLQSKQPLTKILSATVDAANATPRRVKPVVMVKVSPDENAEEQIRGICDAVWESGVAGVIVGNTTMRRPDPAPQGYLLPDKEARLLVESGGYSGPQLFQRTKELVGRYRKALDNGPNEEAAPASKTPKTVTSSAPSEKATNKTANTTVIQQIEASTARDIKNLKPMDEKSATGQGSRGREIGTGINIPQRSSESHPIIRIPDRHLPNADPTTTEQSGTDQRPVQVSTQSATPPASSLLGAPAPAPAATAEEKSRKGRAFDTPQKVIFASGGITNGEQALEVLNAGASVAMCYTGLVYGGVGTISRMKEEMRESIKAQRRN